MLMFFFMIFKLYNCNNPAFCRSIEYSFKLFMYVNLLKVWDWYDFFMFLKEA